MSSDAGNGMGTTGNAVRPGSADARRPDDPEITAHQAKGNGIHQMVIGAMLAGLAPLAGFLGGSMSGSGAGDGIGPLYSWLFGGLVVGGIGIGIAFLGGLRWMERQRDRSADPDDPGSQQ